MKACVLHQIGDIRYQEVEKPVPEQGQVLIKVRACGVCGSDIPRIFEKGTYSFPTIPGHEFSGEIVEIGKGVKKLKPGSRGAVIPLIPCKNCIYCQSGNYAQCEDYNYLGSRCDGGFAEYVVVPEENFLILADNVTFEEAAMVEPAAVALHSLRRAEIDIGDTVTVLGAGPIGLIVAQLALVCGATKVFITDVIQEKLDFAEQLGFENIFNSRRGDPVEWIKEKTAGLGTDVVIEAAGVAATFEQSILISRKKGNVVIMGNPADNFNIKQKVISQFLRKEINLRGTWNSYFAQFPKNEWQLVLELLAAKKINLKSLITHRASLADMEKILNMMKNNSEFYNKVMFLNN